jgi:hypothetical protein
MIDIDDCRVEGEVSDATTFEVKGTYDNDEFHCRLELKFPPEEDPEDYEVIDGVDLSSIGHDVIEDLLNEVYETECYQEAVEAFEKASK